MQQYVRGGEAFENEYLLQHAALIAKHNALFEVPDVTNFAEYTSINGVPASLAFAAAGPSPGKLETFRYPNGRSKTRDFAVATFADHLRLRLIGEALVVPLSALLGDRAFAPRIVPGKTPWLLEPKGAAYERWLEDAREACAAHRTVIRTDVRKYYPSIKPNVLFESIAPWVPDRVVTDLQKMLAPWWAIDGLFGLPIGPEISGVLGDVLLARLDNALKEGGVRSNRFMDDIHLFGRVELPQGGLSIVDSVLQGLGLQRAEEKTLFFDDSREAMRSLRSQEMSALGSMLRLRGAEQRRAAREEMHEFCESNLWNPEVSASTYRWILKTLGNKKDQYAVEMIVRSSDLAEIDPRVTAEYLGRVNAFVRPDVIEMIGMLLGEEGERVESVQLHLLRALVACNAASPDLGVRAYTNMVQKQETQPSLRAWAISASSHAAMMDSEELVYLALDEDEPLVVCRAAVASMMRTELSFLRAAANCDDPQVQDTANWMLRKAA